MLGWKRASVLPIGLDIGRHAVRMLQVETRAGGQPAVRAAARHELPREAGAGAAPNAAAGAAAGFRAEEVARAVRRMLGTGAFAGRRVVASVPRHLVQVKSFRLPLMPPEELEAAVRFEARHVLAGGPTGSGDDLEVRFLPAGEVRQGGEALQEVIVLAVHRADLDALVEMLHGCGLAVESIDVEPCALFRTVERFVRRREDEREVHVLLDVGYGGSQIVIARGREVNFVKCLDVGGAHLDDAAARGLGITPAEAAELRRKLASEVQAEVMAASPAGPAASAASAVTAVSDPVRRAAFDAVRASLEHLAREVSLCLRYQSVTFRGSRPTRLRLYGGEAADPALRQVLAGALPVPVEAGAALRNLDGAEKAAEAGGPADAWGLALGLSLRGTQARFAPRDGAPRSSQARPAGLEAGGAGNSGETHEGHRPAAVAREALDPHREPSHA